MNYWKKEKEINELKLQLKAAIEARQKAMNSFKAFLNNDNKRSDTFDSNKPTETSNAKEGTERSDQKTI